MKNLNYEPQMRYLGSVVESTSVRRFRINRAIRLTNQYRLTALTIEGTNWQSTTAPTPRNLETVSTPLLIVQVTGHYDVVYGEPLQRRAASRDTMLKHFHGADQYGTPIEPQYGNTRYAFSIQSTAGL